MDGEASTTEVSRLTEERVRNGTRENVGNRKRRQNLFKRLNNSKFPILVRVQLGELNKNHIHVSVRNFRKDETYQFLFTSLTFDDKIG